jgi:hypothetical protein
MLIDRLATISTFPTPSDTISNIARLNTLLTVDGSVYLFSPLGGSSTTWPGASTGGTLSLTGEIYTLTSVPSSQSLIFNHQGDAERFHHPKWLLRNPVEFVHGELQ